MALRILVVDDSKAIREAVRSCIETNTNWQVCGEAENGDVALDMVRELDPDIMVLDLSMPIDAGHERLGSCPRNRSDGSSYPNDHVHGQ